MFHNAQRSKNTAPAVHRLAPSPRWPSGQKSARRPSRLLQQFLVQARGMVAALNEMLRRHRDEERLREMPDHQLRDIGLQRLSGGHFVRISPIPWQQDRRNSRGPR
ncbi:MAG: DUF1127 domain-containing protein [Aurantimonas endophytica]|nr:DUF1127 domain-containing protein [Aurantimonas endophytica]MCO6404482.1 DUF1127 domain-containing protein [Aurantimonas endophytica]